MTARTGRRDRRLADHDLASRERGYEPEDETVEALARGVEFPRGFFFAEDVDELTAEARASAASRR